MKSAPLIALAASTVMVFASLVSPGLRAQETNPAPGASADAGDGAPDRPARPPSPFAKGTILQIDHNSQLFLLDTADGPREFLWTARTYVYRGKEKLSMDKLRVGDRIKLAFRVNERGLAEVKRIKVDLGQAAQTNQQTTASP
jgi:Cu/Ag efflux protein CusF